MEDNMNQQGPSAQQTPPPAGTPTNMGPEQGWEQHRGIALAARIPILFWLPLVSAKESKLAMFHANQGLLQFIIGFVTWIPIFGWIVGIINFIFVIMGMIDAYNGKMKPLPLIGGVTILK